MDKRYTVFVSSTFTDLSDARWAVARGLMRFNMIPLGMEAFTASNLSQWEIIKKTIDLSDYYILILGNRYGSIDSESGVSYTEKEYRYALDQEISCLAFLSKDIPVALKDIESDTHREKLVAFRDLASKARMVDFWTNPDELTAKAATAMFGAQMDSPRPGWIRNPQSSPEVAEELARLSRRNSDLEREIEKIKQLDIETPSIEVQIESLNNYGILYFSTPHPSKIREAIIADKKTSVIEIMKFKHWIRFGQNLDSNQGLKHVLPMLASIGRPYTIGQNRINEAKNFLRYFNLDPETYNWGFSLTAETRFTSTGSYLHPTSGIDFEKYMLFENLESIITATNKEIKAKIDSSAKENIIFKLINSGKVAIHDLNVSISFTNSSVNIQNIDNNIHKVSLNRKVLSPGEFIEITDFYYQLDHQMQFNNGHYEEEILIKLTGSNLSSPILIIYPIQIEVGQ